MPVVNADTVGIAQAVVTTLGAVLVIGLAFVPNPNRATLLWSIGFLLTTVFVIGVVFATMDGQETLRRATMAGLLICNIFPWAGLRAWRGAPSLVWLVGPVTLVVGALLVVPDSPAAYGLCFRIAFLVVAIFPALSVWEILRSPRRTDVLVLPLVVGSAAFVAFAVGSALAGVFYTATDGDDLMLVRTLNSLGMLIYVNCTFVSIIWLAQQQRPASLRAPVAEWTRFREIARSRLERAAETQEQNWALLVIRLDDETSVRAAAGAGSFSALTAELDAHVRRVFPAEADIGRQGPGRIVVLVPRSTVAVRELTRALLKNIGDSTPGEMMLQNSASVGWVGVGVGGYDFSALLGAASMAVERAAAAGGDRWYRVTADDLA